MTINSDYNPRLVPAVAEIQTKPLLIKDVVMIALLSIASAFLLVGVIGTALFAFVPLQAVGLTLITISLIGMGTLGLIKLWEFIVPYLPGPLRSLCYHIQSIVTEFFSLLAVMGLGFVDLTESDPKTAAEINPEETPTLFIHGFLGSSSNWIYHRSRLQAAGYKNLFTINLGNPFLGIPDYAKHVEEKAKEIKRITGRDDIRIVSHSMGGLVARYFRYKLHAKVKDIVTLGSPHDGTYMAYLTLGLSACGREMFPGSLLVKKLQELASQDNETNYYHIDSGVDLVILPNSSARMGGAPWHKTKFDTLKSTGHVGYLFSDEAADLILAYFKNTANEMPLFARLFGQKHIRSLNPRN